MATIQIIGKIVQAVAVILGVAVISIALWAFLIDRYDPSTGMYYDGFGRQLYDSTTVIGVGMSPGLMWGIVDTVIAIIVFGLIAKLFSFGAELQETINGDVQ